MNQNPNAASHDQRIAQAEARTDEANARIKEANIRTVNAENSERSLRASELSYRRLFEAARDGILILNVDTGRIDDVNPFLVELLGFSHAEMVGKTVGELSPFKDILSNQSMLERLQKDGYIRYENLPLETRDGRHIEVEFVSNVYQVGDVKVIQCNIRDITERKQSEADLLESKRFLRFTLDALSSHIAILDERGTIIAVNAAWKRFASDNEYMGSECGVGANYLRVCDSVSGYFSEEAPVVANGIRAVITGQSDEFNLEYPCHSPTEKRWFVVHATRFSGDGPVRVVMAHENITERKQVEESHARLAKAVEQASENIIITDIRGNILYANPAFEKITGYAVAEVLGKNPRILKSGKHDAKFYHEMWQVLGRGEIWHGHMINRRKDGRLFDEEATISPIRNAAGKVINYVAVKRDVTQELKLESQFRQAQKMESIGTLAGGVAHDFNNILAIIQMQTGLLKSSGHLSAEQSEFVDDITNTVERAAALTRQLLLFSRKETLQPRNLDLNESIHSLAKMLQRIVGEDIEMQLKSRRSRC
jgi:PAS domain S-box-containing protein